MTSIDVTRDIPTIRAALPCPEWCTEHTGDRVATTEIMPGSTAVEEALPVGSHRTSFFSRAGIHDQEVYMQQGVSHAGVWNLETIYVKHGNHGMGGPTFVMSFGSQNARDLGLALIAAADALEAAVSGRCDECGSATTRAPGLCHECLVAANVARFRNLHAVD